MKRGIKAVIESSSKRDSSEVAGKMRALSDGCTCYTTSEGYCSIAGHEFDKFCRSEGIAIRKEQEDGEH